MNDLSQNEFADKHNAAAEPGRVAFVLPGLRAGGSEHVVTFVADRLAERGHAVEIVNFETGEDPPYYTPDPRIDIAYLARPVKRRTKLDAMREIAARISDLRAHFTASKPDLIISFLTRSNVQTILATRGLGIPVIVSERNNPVQQNPGNVWRWLRRRTYPMADGLVTMTRGAMECFPPAMRKRSWVIPNMAEWGTTAAKPAETGETKVLTAVGRLTHQKGFDLLLHAFSKIADNHPEWTLRIWGEGADRADLEALRSNLALNDRVELPGVTSVPGEWIETADAFVLSSRFEGWGLVLGEAMAAGLPAVSFACDFGPEDMITHGDDGLLVPDGDVDALADALSRLMRDEPLREKLGARARETSQQFQPAKIGEKWTDMIEGFLTEAGDTLSKGKAR
ncbi:glycosyltransferase family 4 protein [Erythrobacter sp. MTPC3]|uniref:glycosyltransferase family 4 protein n=1 Tax=Erythrobacter sp. MTPC3 TaxID=3056564 RepID=UPI0036F3E627